LRRRGAYSGGTGSGSVGDGPRAGHGGSTGVIGSGSSGARRGSGRGSVIRTSVVRGHSPRVCGSGIRRTSDSCATSTAQACSHSRATRAGRTVSGCAWRSQARPSTRWGSFRRRVVSGRGDRRASSQGRQRVRRSNCQPKAAAHQRPDREAPFAIRTPDDRKRVRYFLADAFFLAAGLVPAAAFRAAAGVDAGATFAAGALFFFSAGREAATCAL